ncbi:hypothetical protein ASE88_04345 [Sphingomonas sp. Leaf38]|nr:hypothetical protein ASE88_04345 [Sphingomonas sp. Leaf38]
MPDFDAPNISITVDEGLVSPLVGDSECEEFSLGPPLFDTDDTAFLYECHEGYRKVLRSALRAARGVDFEFTDFVY